MHFKKLDKLKDLDALQIILDRAPKYSLNISGSIEDKNAALDVFNALPDNFEYSKKFVIGIYITDQLIGVIDLLRGFPNEETAMLGLLLLEEESQGQGFGKKAFEELLLFLKAWHEIKKIRIGVVTSNSEVLPFWNKLGFVETGIRKPFQNGSVISETMVLEKNLK